MIPILHDALRRHAALYGFHFEATVEMMPVILDRVADWCDVCSDPGRARAALLEAIDAETEHEAVGQLLLAVAVIKDRQALFADLNEIVRGRHVVC